MPRNAAKRFPGLGPVEIARRARAAGEVDLISAADVNTYLNKLSGLFSWALKEELIQRNPAVGLKVPDPTARPEPAACWAFLAPVDCAVFGMRLNKICQLDVVDVRLREGVACFVVTAASDKEESDKRLQTASGERFVPVHPTLLDLGIMKFVAHRRTACATKLFPEVGIGVTGYRSATFSA
jgi:integrase